MVDDLERGSTSTLVGKRDQCRKHIGGSDDKKNQQPMTDILTIQTIRIVISFSNLFIVYRLLDCYF